MSRSSFGLTLLLAGTVVSMPVVMVGHILAKSYSPAVAVLSILIGNALLCAIGFLNAHLGIKYRTTTTDTVECVGGNTLAKVFSVAMIVSMLGWFAVQCSVLVEFARGYWPQAYYPLLVLLVGASLVLTTMGDIKRLLWISEKLGPLLLLACLAMWVWSVGDAKFITSEPVATTIFPALSLVIATSLGMVIDAPTYYRFASSHKEAYLSVFIVIWIVTSLVEILGVMLLHQYTLAALITSPFGIIMVASGWLGNVNNLYSAAVSSQTLVKRGSFAKRALVLGSLALVVVVLQLTESISTTIEAITLGISSMGGVIVACVFMREQGPGALAFSWLSGLVAGGLALTNIVAITGAAQIDAFLVAALTSTICLSGVKLWQSQLSTNSN